MKPIGGAALAAVLAGGVLWAQQFKFNLDHLAAKASDSVDLSLNSSLLQLGAKFLDSKDPDEAKVKQLIAGIEGIYIKSFEFKKEGEYSPADLDQIRNQLKSPEWSRIVGVKSAEDGENIEVWVRTVNGKVGGVAILAAEPKELTVANLVGTVDLDSLAELGGHFGLPKMESSKDKKK
jgi:Domain of unknown function (DUF4252)